VSQIFQFVKGVVVFKFQCTNLIVSGMDNILQQQDLILQPSHSVSKVDRVFTDRQGIRVQLMSNTAVNIDMRRVWLVHLRVGRRVIVKEGLRGATFLHVGIGVSCGGLGEGWNRNRGGHWLGRGTESIASLFCQFVLDLILFVNTIR
jgi:hypothetical protein